MSKAVKGLLIGAAIFFTGGLAAGALAIGGAGLATVTAVYNTFALLSLSVGLSGIAAAMVPTPKTPRIETTVNYDGTATLRRILYGQLRCGGLNVIPPWTSDSDNKNLHQVLAICSHEVQEISDVYFNQDLIASANIGAVSGTLDDGKVSSGTYQNKAWIRRYLGTSTQTVDYILDQKFTQWGTNHRGRGIAYLAMQYRLDPEVYRNGAPRDSAIVKGKKVYDPRLDTTPGANPTNASYIAYSTNPALCLADYLTDTSVGCKIAASKIDWTSVVDAANECDENVSIPGSTTQRRYTCNVMLEVADSPDRRRSNIMTLASAMMGYCLFRGGKYRLHAGKTQSSSFALTDDDILGKVRVQTELPADQKYNYVTGTFVDPDQQYQVTAFPPAANASYESTDGRRLQREVAFPACTSKYEAQRNAIILLRRSRRKRQVTAEFGFSAYKIKPLDLGTLTIPEIGWNAQLVRCTSWRLMPEGLIEAGFVEESATDWDDPAVGDYTTVTTPTGSGGGAFVPDAPTDLTVTPQVDGIYFRWTPSRLNPLGTRFRLYEHTAATPFSSATRVASDLILNAYTLPKTDTTTRYYWVVSEFLGGEGGRIPSGDGQPGAAISITTGFRATVDKSSLYTEMSATSGNSASVTVTPVNGSSPYTYSWARISGSTKITANSASAATTSFNVTGLVNPESVSATFRCTVTDNLSATATVDVIVSFNLDLFPT